VTLRHYHHDHIGPVLTTPHLCGVGHHSWPYWTYIKSVVTTGVGPVLTTSE